MKDHHIPCLLLARFSSDCTAGRKSLVFQLGVSGPHPDKPVPAEDLASASGFYDHADFPNLDAAGLHDKEGKAASLLRALVNGADPAAHALDIAELVTIQSVRTSAWRMVLASVIEKAFHAFLMAAPAKFQERALAMIGGGGIEDLVRFGIQRDLAETVVKNVGPIAVRQAMRQHAPSVVQRALKDMAEAFALVDSASVGAMNAQIKALHSFLAKSTSQLDGARWVRLESRVEPLVLGDSCVVCVGNDGALGWPLRFGRDWREIYLPIDRATAVVGLSIRGPDSPTLDPSSLNRASAALSNKYIYASRCTDLERGLAARIGSVPALVTDQEISDVVAEADWKMTE